MWKVELFAPNYDEKESKAVNEVLDSGWLTMGERTKEFEKNFSFMLGNETKCTALSSATAALHIALMSLGIGEGDEVIIPALTFVADINVVRIVGAVPVLADCTSYNDWNMSAQTIAQEITEKTKAVIIVHFAGYPCQMDEIVALCKEKGIALIEDVAHAPGASYKGQKCGTFGDYGCFSFFTNKNLSVGEGGMLSSKSLELDQQGKYFRSHGMTSLTLDRHKGRAITYDIAQSGLNYRIDEIRSSLGLVQLSKLEEANKNRKKLVEHYIQNLKEIEEITIPFLELENIESAYHIFPILLDKNINRVAFIQALKKEGIQSSIHYPTFKNFTAFKNLNLNMAPIAEDISSRELTLPLYPTMSFKQVELVCNTIKKIINR
ncbi:MAG: Bacillosamine/Legionaminic acid biosynthesis aminotransferase PglE; 4-keto-6-deoxy-N-Acetyl-D-hexosaminyl-(Lipid carrier) aminotransferase [uncultured Sulfurovum sp.]|uniref:Bacillosamine/Legionaminic acid biosynthesis aminotransferase PglE 4-keto-6-deoxy-N-Acetyl-D-hexosaminyl-(Lipid carrier) aminotransferase n=1 Tax=uncultured Sulfurovum sp. TaxID=269237 RepID=A0A6S6T5G9_9BACT|nr:MAG: Bacillosamine/Legionaminic acid biosynthesis aminotransferase PglE; 4-keto-6-deoxy-N-Acetyl-D-hexosaminyl-(Lipid carrier) aminotransferase [uncultured Sulfurovum sp.]